LKTCITAFVFSPTVFPNCAPQRKEKKLYMWDWSLCEDPAARFENIVASNLLKYCHRQEDWEGDRMELTFVRDSQKREIDFVVLRDKKPLLAVECKSGEQSLSRNIAYFASRTNIPIFYQVHMGKRDYEVTKHRARVLPVTTFAQILSV
jgi:uncharacterized protein